MKKIIQAGIVLLFCLAVTIGSAYFGEEQIQNAMKKQICADIIKYEDELLEIAKECPSEEALYYQDWENEIINRIFETFRLSSIRKNKDNSVTFLVRPTVMTALWGGYMYGFYYTEKDKPIDAMWGKDMQENEYEAVEPGFGKYWYRTEKITDHWWHYEMKVIWYYPPAHRF